VEKEIGTFVGRNGIHISDLKTADDILLNMQATQFPVV